MCRYVTWFITQIGGRGNMYIFIYCCVMIIAARHLYTSIIVWGKDGINVADYRVLQFLFSSMVFVFMMIFALFNLFLLLT